MLLIPAYRPRHLAGASRLLEFAPMSGLASLSGLAGLGGLTGLVGPGGPNSFTTDTWHADPTSDGDRPAPLAVRSWGSGTRIALLVHGMMSDSASWWQLGPELADRGYRAIAVDLPGHGRSPRGRHTMAEFVTDLLASVPAEPELVIAHSMGAFVVAAALPWLRPQRVVFVDTPFGPSRAEVDPAALTAVYEKARSRRTLGALREQQPDWDERDRLAEAEAALSFDVATGVGLLADAAGQDYTPGADRPTLLVRSDPSRMVKAELAARLTAQGWTVRGVAGADHSVWYGHVPEFLTALDGWL